MTCDKYKNALRRVVASNGEPDAKLARHLERCSTCRRTLHSENELLSRIDAALREQVNGDPRPGFLAQLRLRLSKEPTARPGADRVWHVAGAALALVLIAMFYPLFNQLFNPLVNARRPSVQGSLQPPTIEVAQSAGVAQSARAREDSGVRFRHHSRRPAIQSAVPQDPEVLVPPDEQKAFAQFVACVARHDAIAQAVVALGTNRAVNTNTELPRVSSVDIADLQMDRARQKEWIDQTGSSE
jgi:hypothetical protein